MAAKMIVWKDRDNPVFITLRIGTLSLTGEQMESLTKVELRYNGVYYDSTTYPGVFDWTTYKADGKIKILPGLLPFDVATGPLEDVAELIVYDAANTHGIMWCQIPMVIMLDANVDL